MSNPYQILRVQPDANPAEIEEAYHRLRKLVSYGGAGSSVSERTITTAYTVLSDPYRRTKLDQMLKLTRGSPSRAPARVRPRRGLLGRILEWLPFG